MSTANGTTPSAPRCGDCGETFASAAFGGSALFLVETLRAGARTAGWAQIAGKWKCSVCLAGITGPLYGPEREPASSLPVPDTDPLDQSLAILAEFDAKVPGFWSEVNQSNSTAVDKTKLRVRDAHHGFAAIFHRSPDLRSDSEADVALLSYEAELTERREAMHRETEQRLAELRDRTSVDMAATA
jgi:hypothetical protein